MNRLLTEAQAGERWPGSRGRSPAVSTPRACPGTRRSPSGCRSAPEVLSVRLTLVPARHRHLPRPHRPLRPRRTSWRPGHLGRARCRHSAALGWETGVTEATPRASPHGAVRSSAVG